MSAVHGCECPAQAALLDLLVSMNYPCFSVMDSASSGQELASILHRSCSRHTVCADEHIAAQLRTHSQYTSPHTADLHRLTSQVGFVSSHLTLRALQVTHPGPQELAKRQHELNEV